MVYKAIPTDLMLERWLARRRSFLVTWHVFILMGRQKIEAYYLYYDRRSFPTSAFERDTTPELKNQLWSLCCAIRKTRSEYARERKMWLAVFMAEYRRDER